jgi:hypothetical protein
VSRFQFPQQGKFAFVAFTNVYTDISNEQRLPDGTWVFHRFPVEIDNSWKEWLGTLGVQELEDSNLFIVSSEASTLPQVLDEHHEKLKRKVSQTFSLLQMLEGLEYSGANLLCGSFFEGKSHIRHMSEFPMFYQTRGCTRVPVTIERLEKAAALQRVLAQMDALPDDFKRFKKG